MPLSALLRCCAAALVLAALTGCAPGRDEFPPVCPHPGIPPLTQNLTIYRPGSNGEHLTELLVTGRMMAIGGQCKLAEDKGKLDTTVQYSIELTRGPALRTRSVDVATYVALIEGERILDKRIITLRGTFPPNVDTINVTTGELQMLLPISATRSGAAYTVLAGFQLTPEQAAAARAHPQE